MYLVTLVYILLIVVCLYEQIIKEEKPLCIAHRGASAFAPENTIAAFDKAVQLKADYIELDIQMSKDQEIVVTHDTTINRTTGVKGNVRQYTLEELKKFDAGSWFHPNFRGQRIPSLKEVLNRYKGKVKFLIELKDPHLYKGIEKKLKEELAEFELLYNYNQTVIVQSFDSKSLKRLHNLASDLPLGLLTSIPPKPNQLNDNSFYQYINPHYLGVTEELIEGYKKKGIKSFVWTVNDQEIYERLKKISVEGIITDSPNEFDPDFKGNFDYYLEKVKDLIRFLVFTFSEN